MGTVLTVFRSGATEVDLGPNTYKGGYLPEYVQAMQRQVRKWAPKGTRFVCLSDVQVPDVECIPLTTDWPGWWSKMEMFRPDLDFEFFYTDLDNLIVGRMNSLFPCGEFVLNGPPGIWNTGAMHVPRHVCAQIWGDFTRDPERHMAESTGRLVDGHNGDEVFLIPYTHGKALKWDDVAPGQVVFSRPIVEGTGPPGLRRPLANWKPRNERVLVGAGKENRPWKHELLRPYGMYDA